MHNRFNWCLTSYSTTILIISFIVTVHLMQYIEHQVLQSFSYWRGESLLHLQFNATNYGGIWQLELACAAKGNLCKLPIWSNFKPGIKASHCHGNGQKNALLITKLSYNLGNVFLLRWYGIVCVGIFFVYLFPIYITYMLESQNYKFYMIVISNDKIIILHKALYHVYRYCVLSALGSK